MMDFIMVPAVFAIITVGVYKLFKLYVCRKERLLLIEKGYVGVQNSMPQSVETPHYASWIYSSLKLGSLLLGMGLGLLVGYLVCSVSMYDYVQRYGEDFQVRQLSSLIYGACVLMFGGLALVISFIVEQRLSKNK